MRVLDAFARAHDALLPDLGVGFGEEDEAVVRVCYGMILHPLILLLLMGVASMPIIALVAALHAVGFRLPAFVLGTAWLAVLATLGMMAAWRTLAWALALREAPRIAWAIGGSLVGLVVAKLAWRFLVSS